MLRRHAHYDVQVDERFKAEEAMVKGWEAGAFSWKARTRTVWRDLDVVGLFSLTIGCIFVLLPLTLAAKRPDSWADRESFVAPRLQDPS